jgi:hypothetical protein
MKLVLEKYSKQLKWFAVMNLWHDDPDHVRNFSEQGGMERVQIK